MLKWSHTFLLQFDLNFGNNFGNNTQIFDWIAQKTMHLCTYLQYSFKLQMGTHAEDWCVYVLAIVYHRANIYQVYKSN